MFSFSLRQFFCIPVLLGLALPAYGGGFTQLPDELFVPQARPDRVAKVELTPAPVRETIISHGREVRLVGVPFLPDADDSIEFLKRSESTWWSAATENLLALWLTPADEQPSEVAAHDQSPPAELAALSSMPR